MNTSAPAAIKTALLVFLALIVGLGLGRFVWAPGGTSSSPDSTNPGSRIASTARLPNVPTPRARSIQQQKQGLPDELESLIRMPNQQTKIYKLYALLNRLPTADLPIALEHLDRLTQPGSAMAGQNRWLMQEVIRITAERDPATAIAFANQMERPDQRIDLLRAAVGVWASADPEAARTWYEQIDDSPLQQTMTEHIARGLATQSLEAAMAFMEAHTPVSRRREMLTSLLSHVASLNPEEAAQVMANQSFPGHEEQLFRQIAESWATKDPDAALGWAQSLSNRRQRSVAVAGVVKGFGLDQSEAFHSLLNTFSDQEQRRQIIRSYLGTNAERDLAATVEWIDRLEDKQLQSQAYQSIYRQWIREDRHSVMEHLGTLQTGRAKTNLIRDIANNWVMEDPVASVDWVESLPPGAAKDAAFQSIAWRIAEEKPDLAFEMVEAMPPGQAKRRAFNNVIDQWADAGPEEVTRLILDMPSGDMRTDAIRQITYELTQQDPLKAVGLVQTVQDPNSKQNLMGEIADAWAQQDFDAALEWVESLDSGKTREKAFQRLSNQWIRNDPENAFAYASELQDPKERETMLSQMSIYMARQDPESITQWVDALGDPAMQDKLVPEIMQTWANQSPLEAAAYVASMEASDTQNQAAIRVAKQWAVFEPEYAAEWAADFKDETTRQEAYTSILDTWAKTDMEGAGAWLMKQSETPQRDLLVHAFVDNIAGEDPGMAVIWANGIQDAQHRLEVMQPHLQRWLEDDFEKAATWLESSGISSQQIGQLLELDPGVELDGNPGLQSDPSGDLEMLRQRGWLPQP